MKRSICSQKLRTEADVQQLLVVKEEVPPEQQECSSSLDQEVQHIKEEQEELWSSQEGEQLQGLEEADITKFTFTPVPVKSEDDEEKPQSSQMETEADGENCGGPEPVRNSHPDTHVTPETEDKTGDSSEPETDDSDDWTETREPQSGSNSLKDDEVPVSDSRPREKLFSCSECGKRFVRKHHLKIHMVTHTAEKPFSCSLCKKTFTQSGSLQSHMRIHTGEKPFSCSVCGKAFRESGNLKRHIKTHTGEKSLSCSFSDQTLTWLYHLRYNQFVGHQSSQLHQSLNEENRDAEPPASSSTDQEDPEPPHIKEEQEELWSSQEGEQLQGLEEADITKFTFTPVPVKSEDDEEKPQSSQMETEADGEDCGGPQPDRNSHPETDGETSDSSERETETDWKDPDRRRVRCSVCAKTFRHRGNLNIHMRTHTGEKPFSCSLCGKSFSQKPGLDYHLKTHTGEKPFSCSVCNKTFRNKGAVTYHMATHTGVKPYSCSVCSKRFRGTSQLRVHKCVGDFSRLHRRQSDQRKKPLSCAECDATFPNNYLLVTHMRMHKGKKLFTCSVCGVKRQFSSHLEIHMRTHTGEKPYSCSVCGKTFSQRGIMSQHMAVHSGVKPFSCGVCGRRFFWHFQIKKHKCLGESWLRRRTRFNEANCGGSEPGDSGPGRRLTPDNYTKTEPSTETDDSVDIEFWKETRQHQSGFTYGRNKKVCVNDDSVEPQSGLNRLNTEDVSVSDAGCNSDKKPFSSSECHETSEDSHTLLTHKTTQSSQLHVSSPCGKGFNRKNQLQVPTRLHTVLKPFGCSVCGRTFSKREALRSHMTCHMGEKPFCCSVCNAGFSDSEALVQHMRIHTTQTQFVCPICGEEFAWRRYLTKHMEVHTKVKTYSCKDCDKTFIWHYQLKSHQCVGHLSSQLHQTQTEENREAEHGASSSTKQMETDPDTHSTSETEKKSSDSSETETDDSDNCGFWKESSGHVSGLKSLKQDETFQNNHLLKIHRRNCTGEDHFPEGGSLSQHVVVHREVKQEQPEPPHIKEEQEELWSSQEGEQLQGLEEADITKFTFTSVPVKSEDDEEKPQSSQMETEADGEDCGGPEPDRNSHPDTHLLPDSDSVDSDFWKETRKLPSGLNSVKDDEVPVSDSSCREKLFKCSACGKRHMVTHTGDKPFSCSVCQVYKHKCVGRQSSQLHQTQTDENRETEHGASCSTEQMETEADGEDCGGPQPDRNSHPDTDNSVDSDFWKESRERPEPESDDSDDSNFWKDDMTPPSGLNSLNNSDVPECEMGCNTLKKPYSCPECGKRFLHHCNMKNHMKYHTGERAFFCSVCGLKCLYKSHLQIHMRTHTGEKPFPCPVCGKKYAHKASMQSHMVVHTVEKQYSCSVCDKGFAWYTELKYHQCVGESSHGNTLWRETM